MESRGGGERELVERRRSAVDDGATPRPAFGNHVLARLRSSRAWRAIRNSGRPTTRRWPVSRASTRCCAGSSCRPTNGPSLHDPVSRHDRCRRPLLWPRLGRTQCRTARRRRDHTTAARWSDRTRYRAMRSTWSSSPITAWSRHRRIASSISTIFCPSRLRPGGQLRRIDRHHAETRARPRYRSHPARTARAHALLAKIAIARAIPLRQQPARAAAALPGQSMAGPFPTTPPWPRRSISRSASMATTSTIPTCARCSSRTGPTCEDQRRAAAVRQCRCLSAAGPPARHRTRTE